jgi:hypothetical protein
MAARLDQNSSPAAGAVDAEGKKLLGIAAVVEESEEDGAEGRSRAEATGDDGQVAPVRKGLARNALQGTWRAFQLRARERSGQEQRGQHRREEWVKGTMGTRSTRSRADWVF